MVICIAGMHRSGTSMVARSLNLCGLYLGSESDFIPSDPGNAEGYWEHRDFVALNDDLLRHFGGECFEVPTPPHSWETSATLDGFYRRARELVVGFQGREPWGWKDPRNALTLPFWRRVVAGAKVVVPVRNPLEVAVSLAWRNGFSLERGLDLWTIYHERLFAAMPPDDCVITHYDAYHADAFAEVSRVLGALGLPAAGEAIRAGATGVSPKLRHHCLDLGDLRMACEEPQLLATVIPDKTIRTYERLREAAGLIVRTQQEATRQATTVADCRSRLVRLRAQTELAQRDALLAEKDREIAWLREQLDAMRASRSWRLTRPLRWLGQTLNRHHLAGRGNTNGVDQPPA